MQQGLVTVLWRDALPLFLATWAAEGEHKAVARDPLGVGETSEARSAWLSPLCSSPQAWLERGAADEALRLC